MVTLGIIYFYPFAVETKGTFFFHTESLDRFVPSSNHQDFKNTCVHSSSALFTLPVNVTQCN